MSHDKLRTPEVKVREFQEKLHQSAKANKRRRFHQLYDKVWTPWFLTVAWQRVRANKGAPGPDGIRIEQIEAQGVDTSCESCRRTCASALTEREPHAASTYRNPMANSDR
jgi:RNA-directed DNA polymerase